MIAVALPVAAGVATATIGAAPGILSAMAKAIQTLYGIADGLNQYLDKHIEEMKCCRRWCFDQVRRKSVITHGL